MTSEFSEPIERWTAKRRVALVVSILKGETSVAEAARQHALTVAEVEDWREKLAPLTNRGIITFHDGFRYFAHTFDLELLKAIEEEEGAEASAKEIQEISELIKDMEAKGNTPGVFTEVNGSDATAKAISRETGVSTFVLSMIMSGEGAGLQPYLDAMDANINTILEALG